MLIKCLKILRKRKSKDDIIKKERNILIDLWNNFCGQKIMSEIGHDK